MQADDRCKSPPPRGRRRMKLPRDAAGEEVHPPEGLDENQLLEWAIEQASAERHRADKATFKPNGKDGDSKQTLEEGILKTMNKMSELLNEQDAQKAANAADEEKMMLLRPGKTYSADKLPKDGFRIMGGYDVKQNERGDFQVAAKKTSADETGTYSVIRLEYESGFAWMYWDHCLCNSNHEDLRECVFRYGMGGFHDTDRDLRVKGVFLDDDKKFVVGKFFVLAKERPEKGVQIVHREHEQRPSTQRIYRSAVPDAIADMIKAREVVSLTQGADVAAWWEF